MTAEEVFSQVASHIIEGVMVHDDLAQYYDFLAVPSYRDKHECHAKEEFKNYHKVCRHYMATHNQLLPNIRASQRDIIPESWMKYTRDDVDVATKKQGIKNGVMAWWEWERETKDFLKNMMIELPDVEDRCVIRSLLDDVISEEKCAHEKYLQLKSVDFNLGQFLDKI